MVFQPVIGELEGFASVHARFISLKVLYVRKQKSKAPIVVFGERDITARSSVPQQLRLVILISATHCFVLGIRRSLELNHPPTTRHSEISPHSRPGPARACVSMRDSRMKLWAISDIHLSFKSNREEFEKLRPRGPDDGLILAGDGAQMSISCYIRRLQDVTSGASVSV